MRFPLPVAPKALINYIFFDEHFKMTGVARPVHSTGFTKHQITDFKNKVAPKNGYLYVYVSNESPVDVFFDNLQVVHTHSPLIEETHYYPFGLTMAGISSKAAGTLDNRLKYNGKEEQREEFNDGSGLEWLDYGARMYDNQLGQYFTHDRFAENYFALNPYQYVANNPISSIDINGDSIWVNVTTSVKLSDGSVSKSNQKLYYGKDSEGKYGFFDTGTGVKFDVTQDAYLNSLNEALDYLMSNGVGESIEALMADKNGVYVENSASAGSEGPSFMSESILSTANKIFWDPNTGALVYNQKGDFGTQSPAIMLLHEFGHAINFFSDSNEWINAINIRLWGPNFYSYDQLEEMRVTNSIENPAAKKLGEVERDNHR